MYMACLREILIRDSGLASAFCTIPKDVGMLLLPVLVTIPHMSVHENNTTPISNDGVASLGPMVRS